MSSGAFIRRPAVLLALALCSVGGVVTLLGRLATGPRLEQKRVQLSNDGGAKAYPAFSPDGQRIAYSGRTSAKADTYHIFVRTVAQDTPRQLTEGTGIDIGPAWSPDGNEIAFLRISDGTAQYIVVPMGGGAERKVAECPSPWDEAQAFPSVAWTPDGKSLIIVQGGEKQVPALAVVAIANGSVARITNPPDGILGDANPVVSPDGNTLAFVRNTRWDGADIYLTDLSGANPRRLTFDDRGIRGISWTPDASDIVYSAERVGGWRVWRLPVYGGSPRELTIAGHQAQYPAVGARNHLAFADSPNQSAIWRATLDNLEDPSEDRPLLRSNAGEYSPMYSPDGKKIADFSDQTGAPEVWVSDADGGNRVRITTMNGPPMGRLRWSADSKSILFDARGIHGPDLYKVAATAGAKPVLLAQSSWNGSWSNDGKRIYFDSRGQVWKASADGGGAEILSREFGAAQPIESSDGKWVYFRVRRGIWRVPVAGGEEEEAIVPEHDLPGATTLQMTKKGIYYMEFQRSVRSMVVSFYDFAAKKSSVVFYMKNPRFSFNNGHLFSVSPDGKYIIYPRTDQSQTDLVLVENFR